MKGNDEINPVKEEQELVAKARAEANLIKLVGAFVTGQYTGLSNLLGDIPREDIEQLYLAANGNPFVVGSKEASDFKEKTHPSIIDGQLERGVKELKCDITTTIDRAYSKGKGILTHDSVDEMIKGASDKYVEASEGISEWGKMDVKNLIEGAANSVKGYKDAATKPASHMKDSDKHVEVSSKESEKAMTEAQAGVEKMGKISDVQMTAPDPIKQSFGTRFKNFTKNLDKGISQGLSDLATQFGKKDFKQGIKDFQDAITKVNDKPNSTEVPGGPIDTGRSGGRF